MEAVDRDAPPFNRFKYAISDAATVRFAVDADSGRLTTRESLDRERVQSHQFFVVAVADDGAGEPLASAAVTVGVGDVNDHRPRFAAANDTLTVSSFTPVNYVVARLDAEENVAVGERLLGGHHPRERDGRLAVLRSTTSWLAWTSRIQTRLGERHLGECNSRPRGGSPRRRRERRIRRTLLSEDVTSEDVTSEYVMVV